MLTSRAATGAITILVITIVTIMAGVTGFSLLTPSHSALFNKNWTVMKTDVTVHGTPAFLGMCEAISASCPPPVQVDYSLKVDLINYRGTPYYSYTGTINIGGDVITMTSTDSAGGLYVATFSNSQSTLTYTAWFTNSSLYCVSPAGYWNVTCPN